MPQYDIILTTGTTQNVESSGITTNFKPIYLKPKPTTTTTTTTEAQTTGITFIASTAYDNNRFYTSYDGTSWSAQNVGYATNYPYVIRYINGNWFVGGYLPDASWNDETALITSTDGENWSNVHFLTYEIDDIDYNGSLYVGVGSQNTGGGFTYCSGDPTIGGNWSLSSSDICDHVRGVRWVSDYSTWVAVGDSSVSSANSLMYSTNGTSWTGLGKSLINNDAWGIATDGTKCIVGATSSNGTLFYSSGDPSVIGNWTSLGSTLFTSQTLTVAYGNNIWVAGGSGGNTLVYCDSDPTNISNWVGIGSSIFTTECRDITYNSDDGYFYAVGITSSGFKVYKSNNGSTWSQAINITSGSLYAIGIKN